MNQPDVFVIFGNGCVFHPKEVELRKRHAEDEDKRALNKALEELYRSPVIKRESRSDPQIEAFLSGVDFSRRLVRNNLATRVHQGIVYDVPRGFREIEIFDPSLSKLPLQDPRRISHHRLREGSLPTVDDLRSSLRRAYLDTLGLSEKKGRDFLRRCLLLTNQRARRIILQMSSSKGSGSLPNIRDYPLEDRRSLYEGDTVECAGVFAAAFWIFGTGLGKRVDCPFPNYGVWSTGSRVKQGNVSKGAAFARKYWLPVENRFLLATNVAYSEDGIAHNSVDSLFDLV